MRLIDMLMTDVKPLPTEAVRRATWRRNTSKANLAKQRAAIARYRPLWQQEWERTITIETRMGVVRGTILKTLRGWMTAGLLEQREIVPGNRKRGYEWRWIK